MYALLDCVQKVVGGATTSRLREFSMHPDARLLYVRHYKVTDRMGSSSSGTGPDSSWLAEQLLVRLPSVLDP